MTHYRVTKLFRFEAAHKLPLHNGKCRNLHGHSYKVEVTVAGDSLETDTAVASYGMLCDFEDIKDCWHKAMGKLDHSYLNDVMVDPLAVTAEILAHTILRDMRAQLHLPPGVFVESVRVWETDDSYAEARWNE